MCVCDCAGRIVVREPRTLTWQVVRGAPKRAKGLVFTRYCHHQHCMVYDIQRGGGSVGGRILRDRRAIVFQ